MTVQVKILLLSTIINWALCYLVARGETGKLTNLFSGVAISVGLWALNIALFFQVTDLDYALIFLILYYISAAAIPVFFFLFAKAFSEVYSSSRKMELTYSLPFFLLVLLFIANPHFLVSQIFIDGNSKDVVLNRNAYIVYVSYFLIYVIWTYIVLLRKRFLPGDITANKKRQLDLIMIGTFVSYAFGMFFNLALPFFGNYQLIWVGPLFSVIMVVSIAYAILKHGLFDVKLILVEIAVMLLNFFLFINIFLSHGSGGLVLNTAVFFGIFLFSIFLVRGIHRDIRDRERIEGLVKDMEVANERLRMMEGQKTEFVSIASHQLRTPLTVIKGYASMILDGTFGYINDSAREALEKLYKSSERIVSLVEELLTVSRIEQGRMVLNFETIDLKVVVQGVIDEMENEIEEAKIDLSFTPEAEKEFPVSIDEKKFRQVVKHIIENAIRYVPAPGSVSLAIFDDLLTKKIRLAVSDTGIGMTSEQITSIFERFNLKANAKEKTDEHGDTFKPGDTENEDKELKMMEKRTPGIGLYIVQEIMEAHRGILRIESEGTNRGTTVVLELPKANES